MKINTKNMINVLYYISRVKPANDILIASVQSGKLWIHVGGIYAMMKGDDQTSQKDQTLSINRNYLLTWCRLMKKVKISQFEWNEEKLSARTDNGAISLPSCEKKYMFPQIPNETGATELDDTFKNAMDCLAPMYDDSTANLGTLWEDGYLLSSNGFVGSRIACARNPFGKIIIDKDTILKINKFGKKKTVSVFYDNQHYFCVENDEYKVYIHVSESHFSDIQKVYDENKSGSLKFSVNSADLLSALRLAKMMPGSNKIYASIKDNEMKMIAESFSEDEFHCQFRIQLFNSNIHEQFPIGFTIKYLEDVLRVKGGIVNISMNSNRQAVIISYWDNKDEWEMIMPVIFEFEKDCFEFLLT